MAIPISSMCHSFIFFGYGFQSVPRGFYVHTVDGSEIPNNQHLGCFCNLVMNGINGSQPPLVKLSMMSGSEPSKEPRSWSYAWWILGTLCEGPTFQRFILLSVVQVAAKVIGINRLVFE